MRGPLRSLAAKIHAKERSWAKQGIKFRGRPLTYEVYLVARERVQGGCCAVCSRNFGLFAKGAEAADHDHKTGEFRGVLCAKKTGCNLAIIGRYERGQVRNLTAKAIRAAQRYLTSPPARMIS